MGKGFLMFCAFLFPPCYGPQGMDKEPKGKESAVRLEYGLGSCSGTIVKYNVILTATHCLESQLGGIDFILRVNGTDVKILDRADDGSDHTLLKVDQAYTSDRVRPISRNGPWVGQKFQYWGNPSRFENLYRLGYVSGYSDAKPYNKTVTMLDVNGFMGDSGAGVLDMDGKVIGVVSILLWDRTFTMMGMFDFTFKEKDLTRLGMRSKRLLLE